MTNNYDHPHDLDVPRYQPPVAPQVAAKGQLNLALASAIQEAQALANYYDNVAKQLSLLASQVEHTK